MDVNEIVANMQEGNKTHLYFGHFSRDREWNYYVIQKMDGAVDILCDKFDVDAEDIYVDSLSGQTIEFNCDEYFVFGSEEIRNMIFNCIKEQSQ